MSRLENPNGSTSHCKVVKSSHLREQVQLHLPWQVLPACMKQIGFGQVSDSLSFSSSFAVICKTFQERDTFDCDIFSFFYTFKGLCLVIWFEGNSISKFEGQ